MANYYRLKDNFSLRGWEKLPYAIIEEKSGVAVFVDNKYFNALNLCNGNIDTSLPLISNDTRKMIQEGVDNGVIEACNPGQGISEKQKYKYYPVRYVRLVHWSITGRCNYKCKHCYLSAPDAKYGELTHDEIMRIIPQIKECGINVVSLTGGEPLVRPDFLEIVDALLENDIKISQIYSNGYLVNEKLLRELDARKIHPEFNMSYDGEGWHDWLRGINGAEDAVNRAFSLCRDMGFPTGSEMCLHRLNMHTLRASVKHLASLGVKSLKVSSVMDAGDWEKNKENNSLSIKESYQTYLDYIPVYYADGMPLSLQMSTFFYASPSKPDEFRIPEYQADEVSPENCVCGCARTMLYISPDGRLMPCMPMAGTSIHDKMPLLTENTLIDAINKSFWFELVNRRVKEFFADNEECWNCEYAKHCRGGCRADALRVDQNNYMGKSPSVCELLRGEWPKKIIEAVKRVKPEAKLGDGNSNFRRYYSYHD